MSKILYPLIATAFVTITPFLLTFEKGQDLTRGLFNFSVFALLLLFVFIREAKARCRYILLAVIAGVIAFIGYIDLQNILAHKTTYSEWLYALPVVTTCFALVMLKNVKRLALNTISFILFVSLGVHVVCSDLFPSQPIFETPIINALPRFIKSPPNRKVLSEFIKSQCEVKDSSSITYGFVDSTRNNVVILVESWGVPLDSSLFNEELELFSKTSKKIGVHSRMYSKTRTAEREDLIFSINFNKDGFRDSIFIPTVLKDLGFTSTFIFGGDSLIQHRNKYIHRLDFDKTMFSETNVVDSEVALKLDSLLSVDPAKKTFLAWTTHDTQFPMGEEAALVEKMYYEKLFNTLKIIAELAQRHPETRFIVQGDHDPILSPREFREKFYRRWVPFVVLN